MLRIVLMLAGIIIRNSKSKAMNLSQKMVECYQLLNDNSYNDCIALAKKQLGCTIELAELKSITKNKSILEDVTIEHVNEHNVSIKELFDEFQRTVRYRFKQTLNDLIFGIIENLVSSKDEKEKESMVSDIIVLIKQLSSDTAYFNKILKTAKVPAYNNIGCKNPFSRYYYLELSSFLELYLKKIIQRYSLHISETAKTYIKSPPSLQAFMQLYSISEWEKTISDQQNDQSDFPSLVWKGQKVDLTELAIALIQSGSVKIENGKNTEGNIGANLFTLFNVDLNMTEDKFWKAINDLKKRDKPVIFLNTLSKSCADYIAKRDESKQGKK